MLYNNKRFTALVRIRGILQLLLASAFLTISAQVYAAPESTPPFTPEPPKNPDNPDNPNPDNPNPNNPNPDNPNPDNPNPNNPNTPTDPNYVVDDGGITIMGPLIVTGDDDGDDGGGGGGGGGGDGYGDGGASLPYIYIDPPIFSPGSNNHPMFAGGNSGPTPGQWLTQYLIDYIEYLMGTPSGLQSLQGFLDFVGPHIGDYNREFLQDWLQGNLPSEIRYEVGEDGSIPPQLGDMMNSLGAQLMRDEFYDRGGASPSNSEYGSFAAYWDTIFNPATRDWTTTCMQVGAYDSATVVDNGDGTITFTIVNTAGMESFWLHQVPDSPYPDGPMHNVVQIFSWTEVIDFDRLTNYTFDPDYVLSCSFNDLYEYLNEIYEDLYGCSYDFNDYFLDYYNDFYNDFYNNFFNYYDDFYDSFLDSYYGEGGCWWYDDSDGYWYWYDDIDGCWYWYDDSDCSWYWYDDYDDCWYWWE